MVDKMIKSLKLSSADILIITISLLLLVYSSYRAAILSFTIDESISFNYLEGRSFMDIVSYKHATANHHMLNALFMKYLSGVFGESEFVLRIHSLLSHVIYMIFTYKILIRFCRPLMMITGFIILNLNPYLLDFFSLARGYSMAVAFTVTAVYFHLLYLETKQKKDLILSLIFSAGAVLSNFATLILYSAFILSFNVFWIRSEKNFRFINLVKKNIPIMISILSLFIILFEPIRKLTTRGEFYDGGHIGFWTDTVKSLIWYTFYDKPVFNHIRITEIFVALVLISMLILFFYNLIGRKEDIEDVRLNSIIMLLFSTGFISIIQHYVIGSNFLINRMALFILVIFFIALIMILDNYNGVIGKFFNISIAVLLAFFCIINTVSAFNTSHTLNWQYDSDTKNAMIDLEKEVGLTGKASVSMGVMWLFEPTVNFYRQTKKYSWLEEVKSEDFRNGSFDYYFLKDTNLIFVNEMKLEIIKEYKSTSSYLIKREENRFQDN